MIKKIFAVLMTMSFMSTSVLAASVNSLSRSNVVIKDESSLAFVDLLIEPRNQVETGSSIVISLTNATVFLQDIIDGTSSDENEYGYNPTGYQYQYISGGWNSSESFYDVMPSLSTAQLPYHIRRINDNQYEVKLINVPDVCANNSMQNINGVGRTPYYSIPLVAYADGIGEISISIDSNGSSISEGLIGQAEIFEKKNDTTSTTLTTETTETSTETTTQAVVDENKPNNGKSVEIQIGADYMTVDGTRISLDVPAYIQPESQSTLVPLRAVSEAFGGDNAVQWNANTKTATITYNGKVVEFTANGDYMKINGKERIMPDNIKAEITYGRMFVPFRLLGEAMGLDVSWNANTKTAVYSQK